MRVVGGAKGVACDLVKRARCDGAFGSTCSPSVGSTAVRAETCEGRSLSGACGRWSRCGREGCNDFGRAKKTESGVWWELGGHRAGGTWIRRPSNIREEAFRS